MKILLIQIRQLGDVLLSSPLGRVIKEEIPNVEVHFLTSVAGKEILERNPFIDKILTIDKGFIGELKTIFKVYREKYDAVVDIQRTGRSKRITFFSGASVRVAFKRKRENFYYNKLIEWKSYGYTVWERMELLRGIGINKPIKKYLPKTYLSEEELKKGREIIEKLRLQERSFFVVVPTSRRIRRAWQPEKFGILATYLSRYTGLKPLVVYAPGEEELAERAYSCIEDGVIIEEPLSIRMLASVISHSAFLLGNDSFASHLSLSLGRKTIVILGPNEGWFPEVKLVIKIKKNLPCQPCGNWKTCSRDMACYTELSPKEAFNQIVGVL
ncbi:heptosyltransferase-2/heptosyltransferase-3 [Desulfurobacterium pacificum]|uniref:Heptosyltransferase-2/heptosyltransferase-3 n=1 Tax=Desulfurobacterium pacificum TaxID=240166 RepID=A0ABY1NUV7_9BACT|nr:glycosyltransferase family 9 protein [Desulfurobacterium pacificum]SMP19020.1 heptosyltransferase-2/heptosyltransferase-3 [Desulfurobacterium pacificum]